MLALRGGTTTKASPLDPDGELALIGDLAAAAEATAPIMKTKVAFVGVSRFLGDAEHS
jgi:hypothetical protein